MQQADIYHTSVLVEQKYSVAIFLKYNNLLPKASYTNEDTTMPLTNHKKIYNLIQNYVILLVIHNPVCKTNCKSGILASQCGRKTLN
jgi:hypothetical protein